ncbi:MAG: hypothetical protein A3I11_02695 [Elusimicrobia bacterium RIFCSPLOWO2_02_FULL_39_32]|nr:MAG: hypothetical protein A3B80_01500 [Elusimicrobia bacterium RIFCSPHIGHO2_02_FULL_39_36]OGR93637.1 MAG: hypothetical protein A3I11_02695 [Elusimicrobia bacterium RIFCSPLOWO2_02_FULL_39_32]OGS00459.1 MAG: hypothetical protein A3G85_09125 [Elusimicrobia bacterium RIFCSPLOWO2_12_FULL_39_28]
MSESKSDSDIIQEIRNGEIQSFAEIIKKYQNKVLNLCHSIVGESHAEDAAQEIFIKAYQSLPNLKISSFFSTWLYRIAYNHCLNILSKQKINNTVSLDALDQEIEGIDPTFPSKLETEEAKELIQKALELLPPEARMILTLREMEGLSYKELALLLEIPVETIKVRLFRARKSLILAFKKIGL